MFYRTANGLYKIANLLMLNMSFWVADWGEFCSQTIFLYHCIINVNSGAAACDVGGRGMFLPLSTITPHFHTTARAVSLSLSFSNQPFFLFVSHRHFLILWSGRLQHKALPGYLYTLLDNNGQVKHYLRPNWAEYRANDIWIQMTKGKSSFSF